MGDMVVGTERKSRKGAGSFSAELAGSRRSERRQEEEANMQRDMRRGDEKSTAKDAIEREKSGWV
jgi:hypothetical protein